MPKKKDVVIKIKLTKQEKKQYRSWMNKAEEISLQIIQLQRIVLYLYLFLRDLGSFILPESRTKWNISKAIFKLCIFYLGFKALSPIIFTTVYSLELISNNYLGTILI